MRSRDRESLLTIGKIKVKRNRGHQRIVGTAACLESSTAEMFVDTVDCERWKVMLAYAKSKHGNGRSSKKNITKCSNHLLSRIVLSNCT